MTTSNQSITFCFYNGIAIFTTVIGGITAFNYHGGEGGATIESTTSNTRYTIRDSDRGEGGAIIESIISNARYVIGNGGIFAASYEGVGGCFNNRIAIFTTIIYGITTFNYHGSEGGATRESIISNTRYVFWDCNGSEG